MNELNLTYFSQPYIERTHFTLRICFDLSIPFAVRCADVVMETELFRYHGCLDSELL